MHQQLAAPNHQARALMTAFCCLYYASLRAKMLLLRCMIYQTTRSMEEGGGGAGSRGRGGV
jgi:hypothetical protein